MSRGNLGGSWKISRDANGTRIVSGADRYGPFYINVKKGQYLELLGLKVRRVN